MESVDELQQGAILATGFRVWPAHILSCCLNIGMREQEHKFILYSLFRAGIVTFRVSNPLLVDRSPQQPALTRNVHMHTQTP